MLARGFLLLIAATVAIGCGQTPAPSARSAGPEPLPTFTLSGPLNGVNQAVLLESLVPHTGPTPDGPELMDDFGENKQSVEAGRKVIVLTDEVAGPDGMWVRVWVPSDPQVAPGDYYAWLPTTQRGRPTLRQVDPVKCPREATIASLAPLTPPDRFRCAGDQPITMDVRTWLPGGYTGYDVDPDWFGSNSDLRRTVSLFAAGDDPTGTAAPMGPDAATPWIDARVPPDAGDLPLGMFVRVTGRFGDPRAEDCHRQKNPDLAALGPPGAGVPLEAKADSVAWCRQQFVVTDWDVLLGPEGRPIDPAEPQLHRVPAVPADVLVGCGGVGMPPLTIRIDPSKVDPVWIETPQGGRSIATFSRAFRLVVGDVPAVVGPNGVFLVDGEVVDPDRGKPGLDVCPGGSVVSFGDLHG